MKIKKKLKIGGITYNVDNTYDFGEDNVVGECLTTKAEILISYLLSKEQQQKTFLHEILHGIIYEYGVDIGKLDEEKLVEQLTSGLYEVFKQLIDK